MTLANYVKFFVQVLVTIGAALSAVWTGGVTPTEWINVAIVGVGALAVFAGPNVPGAAYTKSILSALSAGLVVLASAITGGISVPEIIQIVIAAAGALGVYVLPNANSAVGRARVLR